MRNNATRQTTGSNPAEPANSPFASAAQTSPSSLRCDVVDPAVPEVKLITVPRFGDERGSFSEVYSRAKYRALGVDLEFVQDNHSHSGAAGTIRGMHFQSPPFAQDKLVRVGRGAILDVAVDIRHGSPTFGHAVAVVISAVLSNQLLVPVGFAHGFCSLEPDTDVLYKATNYYSPEHECGVAWNDPALGIAWPVSPERAVLSAKDRAWRPLAETPLCFTYPATE